MISFPDISMTYKPSGTLNMKLSGQWVKHLVRGGAEHRNLGSGAEVRG